MLGKIAPRPSQPSPMRSRIHASAFFSALLRNGFHGRVSRNFSARFQREEEILPGEKFAVEGHAEVRVLGAVGEELVQLLLRREVAHRLEMVDDRERHDHAAAPRRHLVDVKVEPVRQQDDLRRNDRQVLPRILTEDREEELGVGVRLRNAAQPHDGGVGLDHPRIVRRKAGQLQREVGLERGVELARALVVGVPAAVGHLPRQAGS